MEAVFGREGLVEEELKYPDGRRPRLLIAKASNRLDREPDLKEGKGDVQMKRNSRLLSVLFIAGVLHPIAAQAEPKTIRGTNYHHTVVWQGIEVGDVDGHVIGAYENKGVAIYEDGERVELVIRGTLDQIKGIGPVDGYDIREYDDGSTITLEYHGEAKMTSQGRVISGTYTSCRGAGRFEGAKCDGTWTGGPKGKTLNIFDWEVRYTLPE